MVTLPIGIESIADSTFNGCKSLTEIHIPGSAKRIGFAAFYGCSNLKKVVIEEGVEKINAMLLRNVVVSPKLIYH
jgi:hypothetical protein